MIYYSIVIAVGVFAIGYFVGFDRGVRKTHERVVASQMVQRKPRPKKPSYTSKTKQLRLVKNEDTRE